MPARLRGALERHGEPSRGAEALRASVATRLVGRTAGSCDFLGERDWRSFMPPKTVEPPRIAFLFGREEGGEGDVADIDLEEEV